MVGVYVMEGDTVGVAVLVGTMESEGLPVGVDVGLNVGENASVGVYDGDAVVGVVVGCLFWPGTFGFAAAGALVFPEG